MDDCAARASHTGAFPPSALRSRASISSCVGRPPRWLPAEEEGEGRPPVGGRSSAAVEGPVAALSRTTQLGSTCLTTFPPASWMSTEPSGCTATTVPSGGWEEGGREEGGRACSEVTLGAGGWRFDGGREDGPSAEDPNALSTFASIALSSSRFSFSIRRVDFAFGSAAAAMLEAVEAGRLAGGSESGVSSSSWISARSGAASSWRATHSADMATRRSMRSAFGSFIMAATADLASLIAGKKLAGPLALEWETECVNVNTRLNPPIFLHNFLLGPKFRETFAEIIFRNGFRRAQ